MNPEKEQTSRTHAWAQYAFHTVRRWEGLRVFLVVAGVIGSALVWLARIGAPSSLSVPLAGSLVGLGVAFWLLDRRNRSLQQASVAALKALDAELALPDIGEGMPHPLRIFDVAEMKAKGRFLSGGSGESLAFTGAYAFFSLLGLYFCMAPFAMHPTPLTFPAKQNAATTELPKTNTTPALSGNPGLLPKVNGPAYPYAQPPVSSVHRPSFVPMTPFPRPLANPVLAQPASIPASPTNPGTLVPTVPHATPLPANNTSGSGGVAATPTTATPAATPVGTGAKPANH